MGKTFSLALFLAAAMPAHAQSETDDAIMNARGHFDLGRGYFRFGNYEKALAEFKAGYDLLHKPRFLVNMGQCNRMLGRLSDAEELFKRFLSDHSNDDDDIRTQVEASLAEVQAAIAAHPRQASDRPAEPPRPGEAPRPAASTASPIGVALPVATAAGPGGKPRTRRLWIWGLTVGFVALAAGGVALGVALGLPPKLPTATLGSRPLQ